jgi:hypothetical protein
MAYGISQITQIGKNIGLLTQRRKGRKGVDYKDEDEKSNGDGQESGV